METPRLFLYAFKTYYKKGNEDDEADVMASNMLIEKSLWDGFVNNGTFTKWTIGDFAKKIGIHPSIVLGRLHKEHRIPYGMYSKELSERY